MSAIDAHTHAFPDGLAPRAMESLTGQTGLTPAGDGTTAGLLKAMDDADVDMAIVCAIATKPGQVRGILRWQKKLASTGEGRLVPFASVHPQDRKPERWVARIAKKGLPGIKLHPHYQDFLIDAPEVRPIFHAAARAGLCVAVHCGRDIGFENDPQPDRASAARVAAVLDDVPDLKLLCTHMGGWRMWEDARKHLCGRNVYLETSFSLAELAPDEFQAMLREHGPERVCFGSDWPWNSPQEELDRLRQMGLDEATSRRIRLRNVAELLGL